MSKKIFIIFIAFILVIGICESVNASELKTNLDIIQQASDTKYLENDQGYISKSIIDSNKDTGEVTIELKLSNTKKEQEENINNSNSNGKQTEIFIIIDESGSMYDKLENGKKRREVVRETSKSLANEILKSYKNVKIGIIKFADKAKMTSDLTDNIEQIYTAIDTFEGVATNLYDALVLAENSYSQSDTNKLAIILTDGVPNMPVKHVSVSEITKQELINLNNSGINIITMMTELEDEDKAKEIFGTPEAPTVGKYYYIKDAKIEEVIKNNIYNDIIEKIHVPNTEISTVKVVDYFPQNITENFEFSYVGNPSVGTASNTIDSESKTITWNIGTLKGDEVATLKYKLKIKDMKNTNLLNKTIATNEKVVLTYKDKDSKDCTVELTSSPKIQLSEVKEGLTATVTYNPTTNTTGKVTATIKTNKKVNKVDGWTLSEEGKTLTKTYSENITETVHLVDLGGMKKDVEIKITNIITEDDTTAGGKIPQTGVNMIITSVSVIAIVLVAMICYKKYNNYKDIK